jgi:hypothetical protein
VILSACSSDPSSGNEPEPPAVEQWKGPPKAGPGGRLPVGGFNAILRDRLGSPAAPITLALEFTQADRVAARRKSAEADASAEGGGPTTVTLTLDGLPDDSVRAIRYVLHLEPKGRGWRLQSAVRTQRCRPDRGHQDFAAGACV